MEPSLVIARDMSLPARIHVEPRGRQRGEGSALRRNEARDLRWGRCESDLLRREREIVYVSYGVLRSKGGRRRANSRFTR